MAFKGIVTNPFLFRAPECDFKTPQKGYYFNFTLNIFYFFVDSKTCWVF